MKLLKNSNYIALAKSLRQLQERHTCVFISAYSTEHVHYRLHLPSHCETHGFVFDCQTMERHRLTKAEVEARGSNLRALDAFVVSRLNLIQLQEMPELFRYGVTKQDGKNIQSEVYGHALSAHIPNN